MFTDEVFWIKFEEFLHFELPIELKDILNRSGYANPLALAEINNDLISELEDYIGGNFKFMPGHKALLLTLPKRIKEFNESIEKQTTRENILESPRVSFIMKELMKSEINNCNLDPKQRRYSESIRCFAIYLYMMCGKSCYEVLCSNFSLPQPSTVMKYISEKKDHIIEGQLRSKELADYIEQVRAPKSVWLAEDGSSIIQKVAYDSKTEQMVGLVLPINQRNGMPISYSFIPKSVEDIEKQLENPMSSHIYLIMAQPIKENVPPFVLLAYGTDNRFIAKDVLKRWEYTKTELAKYGIKVCGISSDADSRPLYCMKNCTDLMLRSDPVDLVNSNFANVDETTYVQDTIHLGTKLRNRFLDTSSNLPMGQMQASVSHLQILIDNVSKDIHGLTQNDISPDDRQNFGSLRKCFDDRVLYALKKYVPDSECTVIYLTLCRNIYTAFMDDNLKPLERIRRIWHSAYFMRTWKKWIQKNKNFTFKDHFISSISSYCLELNAYALLHLIVKLRNSQTPELFLVVLFSSQMCESTFRLLRSMTTIFWTRINFALLELLHMIGRIHLSNEIIYNKLSTKVNFPRAQKQNSKFVQYDLPINEELCKVLKEAMISAHSDAVKLGMNVNIDEIRFGVGFDLPRKSCDSPCMNEQLDDIDAIESISDSDSEPNDGQNDDHIEEDETGALASVFAKVNIGAQNMKKRSENAVLDSRFIEVWNEDGSVKTVLKSSVIWALTDEKTKLSKDRLRRVQSSCLTPKSSKNSRNRMLSGDDFENNPSSSNKMKLNSDPFHSDEVVIGDWCLFRNIDPNINIESEMFLGMILGFRYKGKTKKDKKYTLKSAPTSDENTTKRGVEVLATWKVLDINFVARPILNISNFYIDMNAYVATIKIESDLAKQKEFKIELSQNGLEIVQMISQN